MAMALAFWLFFYSLDGSVPMSAAFIQPLANVAGILVPFTPAGLGTREAASAAYLHFAIDDLAVAVALATASRFWFLGAEAIVFLSTMIVRSGRKQAT